MFLSVTYIRLEKPSGTQHKISCFLLARGHLLSIYVHHIESIGCIRRQCHVRAVRPSRRKRLICRRSQISGFGKTQRTSLGIRYIRRQMRTMLNARIANVRMLEPYSPDDLNRSVPRTPPAGFYKQLEGYELHMSHANLNALPRAFRLIDEVERVHLFVGI